MARVKYFIRVYAYYTIPILPHEHSILDAKEIHINVGLELNCINKDQLLYAYAIIFYFTYCYARKNYGTIIIITINTEIYTFLNYSFFVMSYKLYHGWIAANFLIC